MHLRADLPASRADRVDVVVSDPSSWAVERGEPIAKGRIVLRELGGGTRYEVFLVWEPGCFASLYPIH